MSGPRDLRPDEVDHDEPASYVDPAGPAPSGQTPARTPQAGAGGVPVAAPGVPPGASTDTATAPAGTGTGPQGAPGTNQPAPTTPLQDDSTRLGSTITGPGKDGGPLYGNTQQQVAALAHPENAPKANDYTDHYHHLTEHDYQQNQRFEQGKDPAALFTGDISNNDVDRLTFGVEEPAELAAANDAQTKGKQQLGQYATAINSGDVEAVSTADEILEQGEPALAFFRFFAPAYNAWKGGGLTYDAAKQAYEAEYGLSFADYVSDATLLADIGQQLQTSEQTLNNSYNALVPTWQGAAASNFEATMTVFFTATHTVTTDLSVVSKDIGALVHGLQQLVLAKAQAVSELYAAELPTGIDGVMASSLVKVAMGEGDERENLIAFKLLSGEPSGFDQFLIDFGLAGEVADQHAPRLATQWCNEILVPQFETREQALTTINSQTKGRIEQAFKEFTSQVSQVRDPYTGMDRVGTGGTSAPSAPQQPGGPSGGLPGAGGIPGAGAGSPGGLPGGGLPGGGLPGGGGPPNVSLPHVPTPGSTIPAAATGTTPQVAPTSPGIPQLPNLPAGATSGPGGSGATPGGVAPGTGLPTTPAGLGGFGVGGVGSGFGGGTAGGSALGGRGTGLSSSIGTPGAVDPRGDIHKNPDGSVSLGPDRALTIGRERGKKGVFTLSSTGADGVTHTYRVHFDEHGNPVVTEEHPHHPGVGDPLAGITSPVGELAGGAGGSGGRIPAGIGGGLPGGGGAGGLPGGTGGGGVPAGDQLQDGTHVGADNATAGASDNAMSASSAAGTASPGAGTAAAGQGAGGEHGGAVGGIPFAGGGARAGAGGGEQESARRYTQRGDVVGEDDLEEWQRMGPVIGEA